MDPRFFEFDRYRLDARKRILLREGEPIALTPKVFEILLAFARQPGAVLDKDDLMRLVWPDTAVEEGNLTQNISVLRKALGDQAGGHRYIVTIPGRGYRFTAEVTAVPEEPANGQTGSVSGARAGMPRSIGVLPFALVGTEGAEDYLSLSLADALITRFGNIQTIVVRPTSAIQKYVTQPATAVDAGRELKVEAILEGSIRRDRDRVRVTAQLVSVRDQAPLWAGRFDDRFTDIFTIEDRMSAQIAGALMLRLTGAEQRQLTKRHTEDADAYQSYLKGLYFARKGTTDGALKAVEHFNQAIDRDPAYAMAYAGLAEAFTVLSHFHWAPREAMVRAKESSIRALELDDRLGEAHFALALVKMCYDREWPAAEQRFQRAIALNPSHAMAHSWYGFFLTAMGRFDEGLAHLGRAQDIDPLSLQGYAWTGWSLYMMRSFDKAIAQFRIAQEMDSSFHTAWWGLGWSYLCKQDIEAALRCFERGRQAGGDGPEFAGGIGFARATSGDRAGAAALLAQLEDDRRRQYVSPFYTALIHAGLADRERTLQALESAIDDRFEWVLFLGVDPVWDFLRGDPRFEALVARLGLLQSFDVDRRRR